MLSIHSLNVEANTAEIHTLPEMHHIPDKDFTPQLKARKEIYIYIYIKGSHLYLLVQVTTKHRKLKQTPFKCHFHHGESTVTIQRTTHPQNVTTRYQQQIFQPTCKAILLLCLILNM